MTTMTFDKLAYIDRLKAAGFAGPQARAMADGLDQALREEVATKSDVAALRNEIDLLRVEVKSELGALRGEMGGLRGRAIGGDESRQDRLPQMGDDADRRSDGGLHRFEASRPLVEAVATIRRPTRADRLVVRILPARTGSAVLSAKSTEP